KIDTKKAIPACREAVEIYEKTPRFAFQLARAYDADSNFSDAFLWYRHAADAGYAAAQSNLGGMYSEGSKGLIKDEGRAVVRYRLAADQGSAPGQVNLGVMYANGSGGLAKDDVEAVRLYRLAADQGSAPGQNGLGIMYQHGRGGLAKNE